MRKELLCTFLTRVIFSLACWSSAPETIEDGSVMNPYNKEIWGGWDPPSGVDGTWSEWLTQWKEQYAGKGGHLTDDAYKAGVKPAGHNIKGWPPDWKDLDEGFGGMYPPPWSYVPKNVGKPPKCYERPKYGDCSSSHTRYGYNPYTDSCLQYVYSGCGGTQNNFVTPQRCEQECINPVMSCGPNSNIPIEDIITAE